MSLEMRLALSGNLKDWSEGLVGAMLDGQAVAMREEVKRMERALEDETSILGSMARGWTHELHPLSGRAYSPSATIWHPNEHIIEAHSNGADIVAKKGRFLLVPVKGGPADRRFAEGLSPIQEMKRSHKNVRLIVSKKGKKMIVADANFGANFTNQSGKNGRRAAPENLTEGPAIILLFWVVPRVRLEKIMDWRGRAETEARGFAGRVDQNLQIRFDAYDKNPDGIGHLTYVEPGYK